MATTDCPTANNPQDSAADGVATQIEDLCKQWEQDAKQMYEKTLNGNPQEEDILAQLKKASVDGIDMRSALGNRFSRAKDGAKDPDYNKLVGHKEKAEFRKEWAKKKYQSMSLEKVHSKSYQQVNTKDGTYRSFAWLVREEGNDTDAFHRVKKYTFKCLAMGPPWTYWDKMWERMEYLHFEHKFAETFTSSWAMYEKEQENGPERAPKRAAESTAEEPPDKKARGEGGEGTEPETEEEKEKRLKVEKDKEDEKKRKEEEEKKRKEEEDRKRKEDGKRRPPATPKPQTAAKVKTKYMLATAAATNLDNKIKNHEEWKWAEESPKVIQPFRNAQAALIAYLTENTYASDFCLLSPQEMKKRYTDGASQAGQGGMVKDLDAILDDLQLEVKRLVDMQAGMIQKGK